MSRLDRLRKEVADRGIIPRKDGSTGLPSAVYYLRVKELAALLDDPSLAEDHIARAKIRSKKRRRKKYLKTKALDQQFEGGGHTNRLREVLPGDAEIECLGWFKWDDRFMSETGFGKAKTGYVYEVNDRRILLTESEAKRAWVEFSVPPKHEPYSGTDLQRIIGESEDRMYREQMDG